THSVTRSTRKTLMLFNVIQNCSTVRHCTANFSNVARCTRKFLTLGFFAFVIATRTASAGVLVNTGFEDTPPGAGPLNVSGYGAVVGPPFSAGFWGAENANITGFVTPPNGTVVPHSGKLMLEMKTPGGVVTQAWQAVDVTGQLGSNPMVELSAWFTVS